MKALISLIILAIAASGITYGSSKKKTKLSELRYLSNLPPRPQNALGGQEFLFSIKHLDGNLREKVIVSEILSGNIPDFQRNLQPVNFTHTDAKGRNWTLTTYVLPDYLAIGSDSDYVRIPLNLYSANTLAKALGCMLPTRKMVDRIYDQASLKLSPVPLKPGPEMTTIPYFYKHNRIIESQLNRYSKNNRRLIAGHKKDVVLSRKLETETSAIAIFGWHQLTNHKPIQPLSTVHGAYYADYSHGIRLVSEKSVLRLGKKYQVVNVRDIMNSKYGWQLVSDEGKYRGEKQASKLYRRYGPNG